MAAPLQVTVAVEGGIEPHRLAHMIGAGFVTHGNRRVRVTVGEGEAVNGVPLNTVLVTNVDRT